MTQISLDIDSATREFYTEIDANDPDVIHRRLTADAVFAFNDVDPVAGSGAITEFVAAWKNNFRSVTHELVSLTIDAPHNRVGVEIVVTYVFPDGRDVAVKGCSFLEFAGGSITSWRVYVDTSRLS